MTCSRFLVITLYLSVASFLNAAAAIVQAPTPPLIKPVKTQDSIDKNIAGEIPIEVQRLLEYLKNPTLRERYRKFGVEPYKGILLTGPSGTGKTALVRAVAGEVQAPFFVVKTTDVIGTYHGVTEQNIHEIFEIARAAAKESQCKMAILFFDEIDAIASSREENPQAAWLPAQLNTLLAEMDGFEKNEGIIVVGATNRLEALDPAIIRPGRFDKIIEIGLPPIEKQKAILNLYLSKIPYEYAHNNAKKSQLIQTIVTLFNDNNVQVTAAILKELILDAARRTAHNLSMQNIPDAIILAVVNDRIIFEKDQIKKRTEL